MVNTSQGKYDLFSVFSSDIVNSLPIILTNYPLDVTTIRNYLDRMGYFFTPEPYLTRNENLNWKKIFETQVTGFIHTNEIRNNPVACEQLDIYLKENNREKAAFFNELDEFHKMHDLLQSTEYNGESPWIDSNMGKTIDMKDVPETIENDENLFFWIDKFENSHFRKEMKMSALDQYCTLYNRCHFKFDVRFYQRLFNHFKFYDASGEHHSVQKVYDSLALVKKCWTDCLADIMDEEMVNHLLYVCYLHRNIALEEHDIRSEAIDKIRAEQYESEMENFDDFSHQPDLAWDDDLDDRADEAIRDRHEENPDDN